MAIRSGNMAQPIAPDYGPQFLLPPALEDWVAPDHPARFLREFVEPLDLPARGFATPAATEGRPPFAPSLLLKIWLYGYFQRLRSTRKLEAACRDHLPLLWLSGLIAPDHNSLWRFWRDHQKALRAVFKQTVPVARRPGAVGLALPALDGTKIQAAASGHTGWTKEYMEKLLAALDQAPDQTELKVAEENSSLDTTGPRRPAGLAGRKALRQQIQSGLAQLAADGRAHHHPVELEARRMQVEGRNRHADNAQAIADEKEGVIVACAATRQETDTGQLVPMIQQARANLGPAATQTLTVAARRVIGSRRPHPQAQRARGALPVPLPRLPGAEAMHARPQRPAGGSMAAHRGRTKDARPSARARAAWAMAAAAGDHQAALWTDQTTRRLPAVDGVGAGERAHAMERAVRDVEPADPLAALAGRAKRPWPEGGGGLGRWGEPPHHGRDGLLEQLRPGEGAPLTASTRSSSPGSWSHPGRPSSAILTRAGGECACDWRR